MTLKATLLTLGLLLASAAPHAQSITETFDNGQNASHWSSYSWEYYDELRLTGGNPGGFLQTAGHFYGARLMIDTVWGDYPGPTAFTGDLAARKITGLSFDLRIDNEEMSYVAGDPGQAPTVYLYGPNGSWLGFSSGVALKPAGEWGRFDISFDAAANGLPAEINDDDHYSGGWGETPLSYAQIMGNVEAIKIITLAPGYQTLDPLWVVSWDNITMTSAVPEPSSYAMFGAGLGLLVLMAQRRRRQPR